MRAQYINEEGGSELAASLNKPDNYFGRHLRTDAICNDHFVDETLSEVWGVSSISCGATR